MDPEVTPDGPAPPAPPPKRLTREDLATGGFRQEFLRSTMGDIAWTNEQLDASLAATLRRAPAGDVWVFGYGSLIWNPIVHVEEQRRARIFGLHRSFCMWSRVGRGTRERPGLVLALDRGGACDGVALRIAGHHAANELTLLWRREMVTGSYVPTWVRAHTPGGVVDAIAFVVRRAGPAYAGRLGEAETAAIINSASGLIGPCCDYLTETVAALRAHGIRDRRLERLARLCAEAVA